MGRVELTKMEAVIYGESAAVALAAETQRLGAERVFILASGTLNSQTDEVEKLRQSLGSRCVGVFDNVKAHVPRGNVIAATQEAKGALIDLIVTVGGGSPTDAAKAVVLCLSNGIDRPEDIDRLLPTIVAGGHSLAPTIRPPTIPQISIPTTLSAGEFSAIAGVTNEATGMKDILRHPGLMPRLVILDPKVARHTPQWLFLSTGVRAIDHCVEGICSLEANPLGDAQALRGLELLANGLVAVKVDADNETARLDCLLGAWLSMGPLASGVPMGASHGIGYVLGASYGIPHGHTSCLMLPAVMQWNALANAERQRLVSTSLGSADVPASQLLDELISRLELPRKLSSVGISGSKFNHIAEAAMKTPWVSKNPRTIVNSDDILQILNLAM